MEFQGKREMRNWSWINSKYQFKVGKALRWMLLTAAQHPTSTEGHSTIHFKMTNLIHVTLNIHILW